MSDICIVLLAAGHSSRYGSAKLLEVFGGETLIRRIAKAALGTDSRVLVVTGAYAERITAELSGLDLVLVHNAEWNEGMGTSIATAIRTILSGINRCVAAIICPADLPLIGTEQLRRLSDAHERNPLRIIASNWGDARGAPCLFPMSYFLQLAQLKGPQGARVLLEQYPTEVECIALPEAATDIDTAEDYASLNSERRK
ncbi:MAG: nucleotidyltransferase family protein [Pseudomonadota bacterium]|nr:nucleotidyltransferase family protein [Pseudomonadota bacterium]